MRHDGRKADELRTVQIQRGFTRPSPGSVLYRAGQTTVLVTASIDEEVPKWLAGKGRGWITAEYNMMPGSTAPRKRREREKVDGRTNEIQRLVGRSLRAIADLDALGERLITVDCDVLEADGGTRTASITAGFIALADAIKTLPDLARPVLNDSVVAISVGLVEGVPLLDLDYVEDVAADVDMNVVMTGSGQFIELQGTGEKSTFSDEHLASLIALARGGMRQLTVMQRESLGADWPCG